MTAPPATWSRLLDGAELARTVRRLAHEVRERHPGLPGVVLAAVRDGGVPLACRVRDQLCALGEPEPALTYPALGSAPTDKMLPLASLLHHARFYNRHASSPRHRERGDVIVYVLLPLLRSTR
jgi:hypothetical protein